MGAGRALRRLIVIIATFALVIVVDFVLTVYVFVTISRDRSAVDGAPLVEALMGAWSSAGLALPLAVLAFAGLLAAVVTMGLSARALYADLRVVGKDATALTRGEIETLDVLRSDEIGEVNRAFMDLYDEVLRLQKAERIFLVRVSHELRTPIAAIRGQTEALADGIFADDAEREGAYRAILSEADRLERLVGDLMDLARMRAGGFALSRDEINANELLAVAAQSVAVSANRAGVEVHVEHERLATIIGDGDRLLQVIGNLLRNAIRWTPRGGGVDIRARLDRDTFEVIVDDSGVGIAPDRRERVFEMFYSESGTGSGVGLAIARDLVRAMGGDITVESSPSGGARFVVRVPRAPGPQRSEVV